MSARLHACTRARASSHTGTAACCVCLLMAETPRALARARCVWLRPAALLHPRTGQVRQLQPVPLHGARARAWRMRVRPTAFRGRACARSGRDGHAIHAKFLPSLNDKSVNLHTNLYFGSQLIARRIENLQRPRHPYSGSFPSPPRVACRRGLTPL